MVVSRPALLALQPGKLEARLKAYETLLRGRGGHLTDIFVQQPQLLLVDVDECLRKKVPLLVVARVTPLDQSFISEAVMRATSSVCGALLRVSHLSSPISFERSSKSAGQNHQAHLSD